MERNSENRNRFGNDRNRRQSDQYNEPAQSSDYQQNRRQNWERDENQWGRVSEKEGRNKRSNYGSYSAGRNDRRLESMGPLGNDWANSGETNDYNDDRNYGRRDTGYFEDQNRDRNYGGRNTGYFGDENRDRNYGRRNSGYFGDQNSDRNYGRRDTGYSEDQNSSYGYGNMGALNENRYRDRLSSYGKEDSSRNWWDKTKDEVSGWFGDEDAQRRRDRDQQNDHRGKGPKGYVRTDERIKEDVHERLTEDSWIDASEIEVDVKNGEVFLKGTVNNRQEKRRAEDVIETVSGVKNIENHIKIQQSGVRFGNAGQYDDKKFGGDTGAGQKSSAGGEYSKNN